MPSEEYQRLVCGDLVDKFEEVGRGAVGFMKSLDMLGEHVRLFDVGCGCGRVARYLVTEELATYVGFDRHPGMIEWCQQEITTRYPNFHFDFFDLRSVYVKLDGHGGSTDVQSFSFPYEDGAFDSILLTSVLTHMPMPEVDHYLGELYRVLAGEGRILTSVLLSDDAPYDNGGDFWLDQEAWIRSLENNGFSWKALTEERSAVEQKYFLLSKSAD